MPNLQEYVKTYGEAGVVSMVKKAIKAKESRIAYSKTPEAKASNAARREKTAKEMAAFRKWKTSQK